VPVEGEVRSVAMASSLPRRNPSLSQWYGGVEGMVEDDDEVVANVPFERLMGGERSAPGLPDDSSLE